MKSPQSRWRTIIRLSTGTRGWLIGLCIAAPLSASSVRAAASFCDSADAPLAPSRDLYCIELVPAVGIRAGTGRVELGRTPGPFTVDVTADGHLRYTPTLTLDGLARPSALGRYAAYVAWVASPDMGLVTRLGVVDNGRTVLPRIALDKFVILVTAEASATTTEMRGRLVLRGMSPSTRLQPPDFMQFVLGATPEDSTGHAHHGERQDSTGVLRWTMVPMPAGISMLPA